MTQTEALKLARGILCAPYHDVPLDDVLEAIDKALAQPDQDEVDIVKRLRETASKGVSVWGDLMLEAAKEIEIITAEREAYASSMERMKQQLKEPEQEPVAWTDENVIAWCLARGVKAAEGITPPQRKPLTDDQREKIAANVAGGGVNWTLGNVIDAVEAAHGIKEKNT